MSWDCVMIQDLDLPTGRYATFTVGIDNQKETLGLYAEVSVWLVNNSIINLIEVFQSNINGQDLFLFIVRVPEIYKLAFEGRFFETEEDFKKNE